MWHCPSSSEHMKSSIWVFYLVKCIYVASIKAILGPSSKCKSKIFCWSSPVWTNRTLRPVNQPKAGQSIYMNIANCELADSKPTVITQFASYRSLFQYFLNRPISYFHKNNSKLINIAGPNCDVIMSKAEKVRKCITFNWIFLQVVIKFSKKCFLCKSIKFYWTCRTWFLSHYQKLLSHWG